jgi:hypothetical protein
MHVLVDILAVGGFWFFLTALVFRGAIKEKYLKAGTSTAQVNELNARVAALEARIALMGTEMSELKEIQDFDRKLLGKSEAKTIYTRQSTQTAAR